MRYHQRYCQNINAKVQGIFKGWIDKVELYDVLAKMADDLVIEYEDAKG